MSLSVVPLKKILFIGHDANRAGAQLVLLQMLRLLRERQIPTQLLLGDGGPLEEEYRQVTEVIRYPRPVRQLYGRVIDKGLRMTGVWSALERRRGQRQQQAMRQHMDAQSVGVIVVNTVASAGLYRAIAETVPAPMMLFVHELAMSVQMYSQPDDLRFLLDRASHLIAVSQAVADYYHNVHRYPVDRISRLQFIDIRSLNQRIDMAKSGPSIREQMGLPADALLVGACGNAEWRKGNDLFNVLATLTVEQNPTRPVYFVWVGIPRSNPWYNDLWLDVVKADLTDRIRYVEPTPDVLRYMVQFDVFALTSREDPYPLVVLEAGLCGVPVVCFDGAGGAPELVETDAGRVVSYLDLAAMSRAVGDLLEQPALRRSMGQRLKEKILERHPSQASMDVFMELARYLQLHKHNE